MRLDPITDKIPTMDLLEKLTAPIFNDFTQVELDYLLKSAQKTVYEKGSVLIYEGEIGHEFYLILEGKVDVSKESSAQEETIPLATLGVGSVLGEISIITNNPRSATVTAIEKTTALVINIEKIKQDPDAQSIYKKLIQNLGIELSKKLIYFEDKLIKYDAKNHDQFETTEDISSLAPNSILTLLGWKWSDIMHEAPFLAEHGYDAIKISPPQEFIVKNGDPWWSIYQPVSYHLSNFYGTEEEFIKMVDFCHGYNLKIYADLILNHMAEFIPEEPTHVGTNNTSFTKYHYGPLNNDNDYYEYDDFYHFAHQGNKQISNEDYCKLEGVWHLEHYDLLNLPKINLKNQHAATVLRKYVKYLLSLGVDGFRIDAAKHLSIKAVEKILAGLRTLDGLRPFIYQEYYTGAPMGIDVYSFMEKYFKVGYVTAFKYGDFLADAIRNQNNDLQKLVEYSFGSSWIHYPENRAVVVIDNHDTERMMSNMLNYKCTQNNAYVLAYTFMLSWPFGVPKIMSSFHFTNHDDPIPNTSVWQNGRCTCFDANSPWVAQHRWNAIANMVLFHNRTQNAPGTSHLWANGNQVAFSRVYQKPKKYVASVGFVVINDTDKPLNHRFETGLPDGKYYDLIKSRLASGKMIGPTITVENYGFATIEVPPFDAIAILIDFIQ
ncbi:MAG: cyclic nucleotide-binding domain-containing protein [Gammaproteobacteria bacterium]|nr:cyclic nucleotide-binding domain-containing protein [Gammaproteobacteria bacterium]